MYITWYVWIQSVRVKKINYSALLLFSFLGFLFMLFFFFWSKLFYDWLLRPNAEGGQLGIY